MQTIKLHVKNYLLVTVIVLGIAAVNTMAATFTSAASGDWATAGTWTLNSGSDADGNSGRGRQRNDPEY
ncbi:MAG: hypothetical protein IPG58_17455 [Acidobacteria bacterium]|nr:hypothetical protein [Acidobacteriota bacterium]